MPEDWREYPLPEVIDFQEGPGIMARDFQDAGIPLIRLSGLSGSSVLDGCDYLDREAVDRRWAHFRVREGDVLLSTSASLGRVACAGPEAAGAIPYTGIIRMRPADGRLDRHFLEYLLRSRHFQSQVEAMGVGSVMRHFGPSHLRAMTVWIPPPDEQRAIAGVLGALDDKIELNRRMNKTLEELAQLRFDATPRSGSRPLGELATLARDSVDPGSEPEQSFEHYSIPAFDDGQAPVLELGSAIKSNKLAVPAGAVLLSKLNPRIPRVWMPDLRNAQRPVCSTEFLVALPTERSSREFLYCLFRSTAFVDDFAGRVAGTSGSHQRVKAADALSIEVSVPDAGDLAGLTSSLRPFFDRIAANRRESRTLADLRDTLLPKLISGELRVRDAEAAVDSGGA